MLAIAIKVIDMFYKVTVFFPVITCLDFLRAPLKVLLEKEYYKTGRKEVEK